MKSMVTVFGMARIMMPSVFRMVPCKPHSHHAILSDTQAQILPGQLRLT